MGELGDFAIEGHLRSVAGWNCKRHFKLMSNVNEGEHHVGDFDAPTQA
jgi:hypothetical protein